MIINQEKERGGIDGRGRRSAGGEDVAGTLENGDGAILRAMKPRIGHTHEVARRT